MSEDELAAIRERLGAITEPWEADVEDIRVDDSIVASGPRGYDLRQAKADAEFIGNAPDDIRALLAEVARARELVAWGIEHIERHQAITRDLAYHPNQRGPDGQPARYLLARADAMSDTLEILRTIQNELVNPDPPPDSPYPPA